MATKKLYFTSISCYHQPWWLLIGVRLQVLMLKVEGRSRKGAKSASYSVYVTVRCQIAILCTAKQNGDAITLTFSHFSFSHRFTWICKPTVSHIHWDLCFLIFLHSSSNRVNDNLCQARSRAANGCTLAISFDGRLLNIYHLTTLWMTFLSQQSS